MWSIGKRNPMRKREKHLEVDARSTLALAEPSRRPLRAIAGHCGPLRASTKRTTPTSTPSTFPATTTQRTSAYNVDHEPSHERVPDRIMLGTESFPESVEHGLERHLRHRRLHLACHRLKKKKRWRVVVGLKRDGHPRPAGLRAGVTPEPFPCHISCCGDVDVAGGRKPQSHFRSVLWNNTMM